MNIALAIASLISIVTWGIHTFAGGPESVKPLLESDISPVPKYTIYYCWHMVTIVLFAMSIGFGYASVVPGGMDIAFFLAVLSASFAVLSLVLVVKSRLKLLELPQWSLFIVITVVALVGIFT